MTPKLALLEEYALIARALGAPHRMMLLEQLAQGERGVEALAEKVGVTVANCSQHLQQLRKHVKLWHSYIINNSTYSTLHLNV